MTIIIAEKPSLGRNIADGIKHKTGITSWSLSQGVCIMKEVARLSIKDEVRCVQ